jgi:hypothetical protein
MEDMAMGISLKVYSQQLQLENSTWRPKAVVEEVVVQALINLGS